MKTLLLALPLMACQSGAPTVLDQIKHDVDSRAMYAHYTGWDKRVLNKGDKGNCAAFAHTYQAEGLKRDVPLLVMGCKLRNGESHAFAVSVDGWALDIRQKMGCTGIGGGL